MTATRTLAHLEVSARTWDELAVALAEAGYRHLVTKGVIDLEGIGLTRGPDPDSHTCPQCEERGVETTSHRAEERTFVCRCGHRWGVPFEPVDERGVGP